MFKKLLLLSLVINSVISMEYGGWESDKKRILSRKEPLSFDYDAFVKDNEFSLRPFVEACQTIEDAKKTEDEEKIKYALENFKTDKMYNICYVYELFAKHIEVAIKHKDLNCHFAEIIKNYNYNAEMVKNRVVQFQLDFLNDILDHRKDQTYDAYIMSPFKDQYRYEVVYLKDKGGNNSFGVPFFFLQDFSANQKK